MWSKLLLRRFRQPGKNPLLPVLQGIAAFRLTLSRMPPRHSQTRRDTNFAIPGYSLSAMIPRRTVKIKFFLSVVIPVVKAAFVPFSATGGKPAIARAARLCGLLSKPRMDRVYALPKQARYQLRYTRLLSFLSGWAYSPKCGAVPAPLYPVDSAVGDSPSIPHSGRDFKTFYRVPDHGPGMTVSTKEKAPPSQMVLFGAGDEARTRYLHLGKVALYQMSYARIWHSPIHEIGLCGASGRNRTNDTRIFSPLLYQLSYRGM